ncbi:hypothetical protein [Knoellia sp. GCM10027112]|uniref:hypothetical protein n=1 Tax=Knoellia sp. GCM10027112 TaxID=3273395 RepID=UPI0036D38197
MTTSRRDLEISACDGATPEAALRQLAGHHSERVRAAVALNPAAPTDLLLTLVQDPSNWVAGLAASHPAADRSVWEAAFARGGRVLIDLVAVPWLDLDLAAAAAATGDAGCVSRWPLTPPTGPCSCSWPVMPIPRSGPAWHGTGSLENCGQPWPRTRSARSEPRSPATHTRRMS